MNITKFLFFLNFCIISFSKKDFVFYLYFEDYLPYISIGLGSINQQVHAFIDIASNYSFISANYYYYDESFSYNRLEDRLSTFKYNDTELKGYLSTETYSFDGNNYRYPDFYLLHTERMYDKDNPYSKCILSFSRINVNNSFSLLYLFQQKKLINSKIFSLDFFNKKEMYFDDEIYRPFAQKNKRYICKVTDKKDPRWNCKVKSINTFTQSLFKDNKTQSMDTTFYFDTNSYFNIVPNHFFRFLIKHLFTYENNHWCEEIVKRKLITWVCDEKGMEMFQRFNGTLKINFDNNFTIIIPNKALFTRKHEFIFASKDIPDDDYNEDAEGEEAVEEITPIIKEEYVFGYCFFRLIAITFDSELDELRLYNDQYIFPYIEISSSNLIKNIEKIILIFIGAVLLIFTIINHYCYKYIFIT